MQSTDRALVGAVRRLIADTLMIDAPADDLDIVEAGLLDSAGFMDLFLALENAFLIQVDEADLVLDNFRCVTHIARYVHRKRSGT